MLVNTVVVGGNEIGTEGVGSELQGLFVGKEHERVEVHWNNSWVWKGKNFDEGPDGATQE